MAGFGGPKALTIAAATFAVGWAFAGAGAALAERSAPPPLPKYDPFQKFAAALVQRPLMVSVLRLFRDRRYADAETALRRLVDAYPDSALIRYNLAAALARQDKIGDALDSLAEAVERGFDSTAIAERDPDLDPLRSHARYAALLSRMREAARHEPKAVGRRPAAIEDGRAHVGVSNTVWEPRNNLLLSRFRFAPKPQDSEVYTKAGDVAELLNGWFADGKAAGNHGDLYDNRDRGHSRLSAALLPQVAHIEYGEKARRANVDYGVNAGILFNAITFGNSSTALTHRFAWRSQARLILTTPRLVANAYLQYANNHLYVYPEHRDHDAGRGDLLPANTPYMIISQGSSGSDKPFLRAIGAILAAFRPEVKTFLRSNKLVMPTVQMVLRRGQTDVQSDADYLSAKAHPSVFSAKKMDLEKMVRLANDLRTDTLPPMVRLAIVEESEAEAGIDYFAPPNLGERLFDTPSAIARIVRSTRHEKRLVVRAGDTEDPNGRSLRFRWVALRGDAARIEIVPLDDRGAKVEIRVPWHERHSVPFSPELTTDRVDIGVFADNGTHLSAPAFITLLYPGGQKRSYDENGRIRCVEYDDPDFRKRYVDPLIFPARDWRDCYMYDASGQLLGWNRIRGAGVQRFTWDGAKVVETDGEGRPTSAERVRYEMELTKSGRPRIAQVPTGNFTRYRYRGPGDRIGTPAANGK